MEKNLSSKRVTHILGVVETAKDLAAHHGVDQERAEWAALLHDFYKWSDKDAYREAVKASGLKLDEATMDSPELSHGWMAAHYLETDLGLDDEDIYYAVATHTTGRPGMSLLEKIIYMADRVEPGRTYEGTKRLRKLAYEDLDRAVYVAMNQTLAYLIQNHQYIHPRTLDARNDLWSNITGRNEGIEG
jgi:predicted HD superfamily hydrolase involved in NAD metabolism